LSKPKGSEIITTCDQTKKQKKSSKQHIADTSNQKLPSLDINARLDSKVYINSPTPEDSTKKKVIELSKMTGNNEDKNNKEPEAKEKFEMPENKRSLGNKPFKIVAPDKEPIIEQPIMEKVRKEEAKKEEDKEPVNDPGRNPQAEPPEPLATKTLDIEILESSTIQAGTIIKMNSKGLLDSERDPKDGRAYFGTDTGQDQHQINDYVFSMEEQGLGKRHFMIEYNASKNNYFLKNLGDGTGTFIRIVGKRVISINTILSFTTMHLAVIFPNELPIADSDPNNSSLKEGTKDALSDSKMYCELCNMY
jgi:hypothetical protein